MLHLLKKTLGILCQRLGIKAPDQSSYQPRFPGVRLETRLQENFPELGAEKLKIDEVRTHFYNRFFTDGSEIISLADRMGRDHSSWSDALEKEVAELLSEPLRVYSIPGPFLLEGFEWRPGSDYGSKDILYLVRPHRMNFLPRLALGCLLGYSRPEQLQTILQHWMRFVEADGSSLAYTSNLVVIQRVFATSWAFAYLSAPKESAYRDLGVLLLRILETDISYLMPRLGSSYANNHLLVDWFCGWYLTALFPGLIAPRFREIDYEKHWLDELTAQTLEDGTGFEQSIHYHEFSCEMASAYLLIKKRSKESVKSQINSRIRNMLQFQADISGRRGMGPGIGNGTEDPLFPVYTGARPLGAAWREIQRFLFCSDISSSEDCPELEYVFWMLAGQNEPIKKTKPAPGVRFCSYSQGGYYVTEDTEQQLQTIFRTGPKIADEVIGGHAHSDLFSLSQIHQGSRVLVDPGTFSYRCRDLQLDSGEKANWRRYLAGSAAHNGLIVEGLDPVGELGGDFRRRRFTESVSDVSSYKRSMGAFIHSRSESESQLSGYSRTLIQIAGEYLVVCDYLPTALEDKTCWYGFQFAPDQTLNLSKAAAESPWVRTELRDSIWHMVGDSGLGEAKIFQGSVDPMAGWVSPAYGVLVPAPQVFIRTPRSGLSALLISLGDGVGDIPKISILDAGNGFQVLKIEFKGRVDLILFSVDPARGPYRYNEILFQGRLLWLSTRESLLYQLRTFETDSLVIGSRSFYSAEDEKHLELTLTPNESVSLVI